MLLGAVAPGGHCLSRDGVAMVPIWGAHLTRGMRGFMGTPLGLCCLVLPHCGLFVASGAGQGRWGQNQGRQVYPGGKPLAPGHPGAPWCLSYIACCITCAGRAGDVVCDTPGHSCDPGGAAGMPLTSSNRTCTTPVLRHTFQEKQQQQQERCCRWG